MNSPRLYRTSILLRIATLVTLMVFLTAISTRLRADTGMCGGATITTPFTDVPASNGFFCSKASAYFSGLTNGTSATTYSPSQPVPREQMAAFVARTLDQSLKRGSRRAALKQWATPSQIGGLYNSTEFTPVGNLPQQVESDGADLWVANQGSGTVSRVRASDGALLGTYTGATNATGILVTRGRIWITGFTDPGSLYYIDPRITGGPVSPFYNVGNLPLGITSDGQGIWTANNSGSVTYLGGADPVTRTAGFVNPVGILYDGSHIWVTDEGDETIKKLNSSGSVLQSIPVGLNPRFPVFDGTNIWVPNFSDPSVTVVRVKDSQGKPLDSPFVLATLGGQFLNAPVTAAFDGQRILVTNELSKGVSLWRAADLTPLGFFGAGSINGAVIGACSDGINFWITLRDTAKLARF